MKKLLLSLVGLFTLLSASADIVEDFSTATWLPTDDKATATQYTSTSTDIVYTMEHCKKGNYQSDNYLQLSGKNYTSYMEFALPEGTKAIKLHTSSCASTAAKVTITVGTTDIATDLLLNTQDADFSANVPAELQDSKATCKIVTTTNKNAQFFTMTYVTDGVVVEPEKPATVQVASIAELIAANKGVAPGKDSEGSFEFTCPLTAIYQSVYNGGIGNNLYVTDGTDFLLVYGTAKYTYKNGDVIPAGATGVYSNYGGLPEFKADVATLAEATAGTPVAPIKTTVDDANGEGFSAYIEVSGVTISGLSGKNFTITDPAADATIAGYNSLGITVTEGENLSIIGFVNYYNKYQISPIEIKSASGKEVVAAPTFSVAAGEVLAGTEVTIKSATEGASIHYTVDGTEPSTSSTLYADPIAIDKDMTIKAIAIKEGMDNSTVASATYTLKVIPKNVATYNFNEPATLSPAFPANKDGEGLENDGTTGNKQAVISGTNLFAGNVCFSATKGASTDAKIYYRASDVQLRLYGGSVITVKTLDPANKITKVVFNLNNNTNGITLAEGAAGALAADGKTVTWTNADAVESIAFVLPAKGVNGATANVNIQVNNLEVTCQSDLTKTPVGIAENPYLIATADDLCNAWTKTAANTVTYFKQTADIDMAGITKYHAISGFNGGWDKKYTTAIVYDGDYHVIKNFAPVDNEAADIDAGNYYCSSIFGVLSGVVKNLGVVDADVNSTYQGAAILGVYGGHGDAPAGFQAATIENCFVTGKATSDVYVGGMIGTTGNAVNIKNSYAQVDVKGTAETAGLVSRATTAITLENVFVAGTVAGGANTALVVKQRDNKSASVNATNVYALNTGAESLTNATLTGTIEKATVAEATPAIQAWEAFNAKKVLNGVPTLNWVDAEEEGAGIDSIVADEDENAPVEYYNLQGVRVENPANGLYIKRQGNKATKVIIR